MNFADSEIVASILNENGFGATRNYKEADLIFLNTCSIRKKQNKPSENAFMISGSSKKTNPVL